MVENTKIKVLNRDNGSIVYSIPEMNGLRRVFQAGEIKTVTFEELEKLSYIPGGKELLMDSLVILDNNEAIDLLLGKVEPEYRYTEANIKQLMQQGSLDEFLDCLDFAPEGVTDLIKNLAVSLPLNDVAKRNAILEKLNFNVDNAIKIVQQSQESDKEETKATRRVKENLTKTDNTSVRRVIKKD